MKSTLRPSPAQIQNPESFQLELENRFQCLTDCETVDELNNGIAGRLRHNAQRPQYCLPTGGS